MPLCLRMAQRANVSIAIPFLLNSTESEVAHDRESISKNMIRSMLMRWNF